MKNLPQNIGDMDRIIRLVGGIILVLLGVFVPMALAAAVVLIVIGLYFVVTGFIRSCPLYSALKMSTKK